jgi:hypothetical protein
MEVVGNVNVSWGWNGSVLQFPVSGMPIALPEVKGGAVPVVVSLPNASMIREPVYSLGSACAALTKQRANRGIETRTVQESFEPSHREFISRLLRADAKGASSM